MMWSHGPEDKNNVAGWAPQSYPATFMYSKYCKDHTPRKHA